MNRRRYAFLVLFFIGYLGNAVLWSPFFDDKTSEKVSSQSNPIPVLVELESSHQKHPIKAQHNLSSN